MIICERCGKEIPYDKIHRIEIRDSIFGSDWANLDKVVHFTICENCREDIIMYIRGMK